MLFNDKSRWRNGIVGGNMERPVVTLNEVAEAISAYNLGKSADKHLSARNPANFFKDFARKGKSAEKNWPATVLSAGYTAVQQTGDGSCFRFERLPAGQTTAFPVISTIYPQNPSNTKLQIVQTLSIDHLLKALARKDENWIQNLAVGVHIPHMHLALHPIENLPLIQVGHMQSNMKLRKAEIDGLYMGTLPNRDVVLMTMEAKGDSDDILESQVVEQIEAIRASTNIKIFLDEIGADETKTKIIPMAMKLVDAACVAAVPGAAVFSVVGLKLLYLVDYGALPYIGPKPTSLIPRAETIFDLRPPIKGISI